MESMTRIGIALSSEEHTAQNLINVAKKAEDLGFSFAFISDHYHPWIDKQGQSPFVWSTLGGISQVTKKIPLGTGVTCPIMRMHPAVIAQAAATTASLLEDRFILGLGTGENLNEHIVGSGWPAIEVRQGMLIEAVEIIRQLWQGGQQTYYGEYFTVERARIYSLPQKLPPIYIAASGVHSAAIAGKMGDGFITTAPKKELIDAFEKNGGKGKPKYGQITICLAESEEQGAKIAHEWWPNAALPGQLGQELKIPAYFQQASSHLTPEIVSKEVVCSLDPQKHLEQIQQYIDAGIDNIYIHQVGPDQDIFLDFYKKYILPKFV